MPLHLPHIYRFLFFCHHRTVSNFNQQWYVLLFSLSTSEGEDGATLNSTFNQRLHFLELRHSEADTLLHVHAALLYELQAQLRNLSASMQQASRKRGCKINVIRATPPLGMRDTLPPGTRANWGVIWKLHGVHEFLLPQYDQNSHWHLHNLLIYEAALGTVVV